MSLIHWNGVNAVARRQLGSFLANPLGYIFILAFVLVAGAVMFWLDSGGSSYFSRNIADLGPWIRADAMGWMLCILLPALGMGTWASERDHGTEEHLLTLPLSPFDALLGKWLAVAVFFTLALACTLAHVFVIWTLGSPDWGLVAANYCGWWLAGLLFSTIALLASTLVSLPAVGFVLGVIGCAAAQWALGYKDWYDTFYRGLVPLGGLAIALATIAGVLGTAVFVLSSRRWRSGNARAVAAQVASLIFAIILVGDLALTATHRGVEADVTSEGLSSLAQQSRDVVGKLDKDVHITAFVSQDLPPAVALKGREVLDKLKALDKAASGRIKLVINRPKDALDDAGEEAKREFDIETRDEEISSAAGKRQTEVFLAAAVTCGGRSQVIKYFDPGLSVEYELVRAIRSVTDAKKRVVGIAATDLNIMGGSVDYTAGRMSPKWDVVKALELQYEVRSIDLGATVPDEIEALIVPQPSTLTQPQIEHLHEYIWNGRPTLMLEDPLPFLQMLNANRSDLLQGQAKRNPNQQPYGGMPPEPGPEKGNLVPLLNSLGLDARTDVVWSDFCPSDEMRERLFFLYTWLSNRQGSMEPGPMTDGLSSALLITPGTLVVRSDKPKNLTITPLLRPSSDSSWGVLPLADATENDASPYGGGSVRPRMRNNIKVLAAGNDPAGRPNLAVHVTGTMPSAYPSLPPGAAKDAKPQTGLDSPKSVNVIVVADVDLLEDVFFQISRDTRNIRAQSEKALDMVDLKNVQLLANAVDTLMKDTTFIKLRTRSQQRRPLDSLEKIIAITQAARRVELEKLQRELQEGIEGVAKRFKDRIQEITDREDLDPYSQAQMVAETRETSISEEAKERTRMATNYKNRDSQLRDQQERTINAYILKVKAWAVSAPSGFLAVIALLVWTLRLLRERSHIPASRRRQS